jgi:hypothetical protein
MNIDNKLFVINQITNLLSKLHPGKAKVKFIITINSAWEYAQVDR